MNGKNASAESVRTRILNESRRLGVSHELLMRRYVFERFLVRLGRSDWRDRLVLKGAMALVAVTHDYVRATRDMDMLGLERLSPQEALDAVRAIAAAAPPDEDPIMFGAADFAVAPINAAAEEPGHQITGAARIGSAVIPLKIEISHGHEVSPAPVKMTYPTVLSGVEPPEILCYTPETMLAEKFEAICSLGRSTSRFKDFYDVRELSRRLNFEGAAAANAFRATFGKRETPIPATTPEAFLPSFVEEGERGWRSFLARLVPREPQSFAEAVAEIEPFTMRIAAMARGDHPESNWSAGQGWVEPGWRP